MTDCTRHKGSDRVARDTAIHKVGTYLHSLMRGGSQITYFQPTHGTFTRPHAGSQLRPALGLFDVPRGRSCLQPSIQPSIHRGPNLGGGITAARAPNYARGESRVSSRLCITFGSSLLSHARPDVERLRWRRPPLSGRRDHTPAVRERVPYVFHPARYLRRPHRDGRNQREGPGGGEEWTTGTARVAHVPSPPLPMEGPVHSGEGWNTRSREKTEGARGRCTVQRRPSALAAASA